MKNTFLYFLMLSRMNLKVIVQKPISSVLFALGMFVQDVFLFAGWAVFFDSVGRVRGWGMSEIFLLYGLMFFTYGLSAVFFNGIRHLGQKVLDGELDGYLTRPVHPLPALYIAGCNPGGFGDIVAGTLFLVFFSELGLEQFCLAIAAAMIVSILFETMKLIFYSFNFYFHNGSRFGDYLTDAMYYLTMVPQTGQSLVLKLVLFSIMPAGFVAFIPVQLIHQDSFVLMAALIGVTAIYILFGTWFFNAGIKRYLHNGSI